MREAKHAYQLDGDYKDAIRDMVGKQVRVTGTIEEASELHKEAAETKTASDRLDIDAGDLAKVNVQGIVQVAEACGQSKRADLFGPPTRKKKGWERIAPALSILNS